MVEEEEDGKQSGGGFTLINVSTDALGLGKLGKELSPIGIEIVRAVAKGFGAAYRPLGTYLNIVAEGAGNRHVRIADLKAQAKLQKQTESERRDETIAVGLVTSLAAPAKSKVPTKRKPKQTNRVEGRRVKSEKSSGRLDDDRMALRTSSRLRATEDRRQVNLELAVLEALILAELKHPDGPPYHIDEDFLAEWIEGVKDVSNDTLREMWAKLLSAAPLNPEGRVPKPVVDLLKQFDANLAQGLQALYLNGAITEWRVPEIYAGVDDIAQEVGLAKYVGVQQIDVLDGFITISTHEGRFNAVELGARALRLGEEIFGEVDTLPLAEPFMDDFRAWLQALVAYSDGNLEISLVIRTMEEVVRFEMSAHSGHIMTVLPDFSPTHTGEVDAMKFSSEPYQQALKVVLRQLAEEKVLKFAGRTRRVLDMKRL